MNAFNVFTKSLRRSWLNQDIFIPLNQCGKGRRKVVAFARCFSDSESHIVKSTHPPVEIPQVPLHEFVFQNLSQWENKIALECSLTGRKMTYKDLYNCSKTLARSLQKKFKLKKGDCQFALLPNCPEYPCILMAGSMVGVPTTTSNPLYTSFEISHQIDNTQAKIIFTAPETYGNCTEALNKLNKNIPIVIVRHTPETSLPPGAVDFAELAYSSTPDTLDPVELDLKANVALPFSSGTSGLPKGVELTHVNIVANLVQTSSVAFFKNKSDTENNQGIILGILPMFHIYGMVSVTLESLSAGDRLIVVPKFDPILLRDTISSKKIDLLYLVPPLVFFLAHHPIVEQKHLKSVRTAVSGAAAIGAVDSQVLINKAPQIIVCQGYGMTETSPVTTLTHKGRTPKLDSVGHPVSLTLIKIVDLDTGRALPKGARGEICVKGPQVMKGYLNQPEITKDAFDSEGWLKTGDIGYYDDDYDFFVSDRIKELIKVKGFQVAPAEIEETLRNHPKVYDVGVIGVYHPALGEVPKAFIATKPGSTMTQEEALEYIQKHLAPHKQLKGGVSFINAIPRNSAGKILRRKLLELHQNDTSK